MQNNNEKQITLLNQLVEINNDRIAGYEHAVKETDESTLKSLFTKLAETSRKCREELASEVQKLDGTPKEGTATTGKIYRVWMDIKAALTNKDRKAILNSCEFGEDTAVKAYEEVLEKTSDLTTEQQFLLKKQYALIKADHDKVRNLRNALVKA
jgi:uncharacterized protein (TIGR02284 family)